MTELKLAKEKAKKIVDAAKEKAKARLDKAKAKAVEHIKKATDKIIAKKKCKAIVDECKKKCKIAIEKAKDKAKKIIDGVKAKKKGGTPTTFTVDRSEQSKDYSERNMDIPEKLQEGMLRHLKYIHFKKTPLSSLKNLILVGDFDNKIDDDGMLFLATELLPELTSLKRLNLVYHNITDKYMEQFASALPKTLVELHITNSKIGDNGLKYIASALSSIAPLFKLSLTNNNIGDDGAEHLAKELPNMKNLGWLYIGNNNITHIGNKLLQDALLHTVRLKVIFTGTNNTHHISKPYVEPPKPPSAFKKLVSSFKKQVKVDPEVQPPTPRTHRDRIQPIDTISI